MSAVRSLSARQRQILALVADGCSGPEIAGRLFLSAGTVKSHLKAIYARLGVHDRAHAVAVGFRQGVLS